MKASRQLPCLVLLGLASLSSAAVFDWAALAKDIERRQTFFGTAFTPIPTSLSRTTIPSSRTATMSSASSDPNQVSIPFFPEPRTSFTDDPFPSTQTTSTDDPSPSTSSDVSTTSSLSSSSSTTSTTLTPTPTSSSASSTSSETPSSTSSTSSTTTTTSSSSSSTSSSTSTFETPTSSSFTPSSSSFSTPSSTPAVPTSFTVVTSALVSTEPVPVVTTMVTVAPDGMSSTNILTSTTPVLHTTGFSTVTQQASLNSGDGNGSSGSGLSDHNKAVIGGVVGGVGGAIALGALAFVGWRLWGKKRAQPTDDTYAYPPGTPAHAPSASVETENTMGTTGLEKYDQPHRPGASTAHTTTTATNF